MTARRASAPQSAAKPSAPKLKLPPYKLLPVAELTPHPRNPRTHTRADIDLLCRKIRADGWTNPIAVAGRQHDILAGHRRRLAALKLGMEMVPTIDLSHLSAAQRLAYIIWDNQSTIGGGGGWDSDFLGSMLGDLQTANFDLEMTGFNPSEIGRLLGEAELPPMDAKPDEPENVCPTCGHPIAAERTKRAA